MRIGYSFAAGAASAVVLATSLAGPASAEQLGVMPDVQGMVLSRAEAEILGITDEKALVVNTQTTRGPAQDQLSATSWVVCWQSPAAGEPIESWTWIGVGVRRPNTECYAT